MPRSCTEYAMLEILAPAGGKEQLIAAVRAGADAVYLGAQNFNARMRADNFASLSEAVSYCHERNVHVHVTLNTLVKDSERSLLAATVKEVAHSGADAVIVQDLAVAGMLKDCAPSLSLHASTQMSIHNAAGAAALAEMGFSRAVLARELSLAEITDICKNAQIDIECFVHGALCMCVSGQCYLSSVIGQRSGNRGQCAQPCRLDWRLNGHGYALSLKDLCLISHISALEKAGVCSLKIEGRMKRPEYVYAAVRACRDSLEGRTPDLVQLKEIFSRDGFTDGYLTGRRDASMFGHRSREDVLAASAHLKALANEYRNEQSRVEISASFTLQPSTPALLTLEDGERTVRVMGQVPEKALTRALTAEDIQTALAKTGGTPYRLGRLTCRVEDGLAYPLSGLNALRRAGIEKLHTLRAEVQPHVWQEPVLPPVVPYRADHAPEFRVSGSYRVLEGLDADRYLLTPEEINAHPESIRRWGEKLIAVLPALVFPGEEAALASQLQRLRAAGVAHALCGNLGTLRLAGEAGLLLHGDTGLNILNTASLEAYSALEDVTVSFECSFRELKTLGGSVRRGLIGYGRLPLMRLRACPAKGENGCGGCTGYSLLKDRTGAAFPLLCSGKRYSTLYNSIPLYCMDKPPREADFMTFLFTDETPEQAQCVLEAGKRGDAPGFPHTRGLYFRELR